MEKVQIDGLSVFANGVFPVKASAGKCISANHRVRVLASVDVSTGEVRFYVESEAAKILSRDIDGR